MELCFRMMMIYCCLQFMLVVYFQSNPVLSQPAFSSSPAFPAVFTFGDSILDVGNNNWLPNSLSRADFAPYGIDFPQGPTGRFSNGKTILDAIFDRIGLRASPPFLDPQTTASRSLQGVNYASGGAGILNDTGTIFITRVTMSQQIAYFRKTSRMIFQLLGGRAAYYLLSQSLFVVGTGGNDYVNNYLLLGSYSRYTPEDFQKLLLSTFSSYLIELYNMGARKFMIMSVGPIGCIPSQLAIRSFNGSCVGGVNNLAKDYNIGLQQMLTRLNFQLARAQFIYVDTFEPSLQMVMDPLSYGFTTANEACCGSGRFKAQLPCLPRPLTNMCNNRKMHLYWDGFHPSEAASIILGSRFYDQLMAELKSWL